MERKEGIKLTGILMNIAIITTAVIALTSGFKLV
ncbi:hypothetical protein QO000_001613 [Alkalihalobacillus hemicentroti]|uniref:Uncharacterized protein n=1 Tax=Guptibacillus hwajinpoensis TaxID=208199 RepID=A0ABU0JZX1_9BACL|nr:hypothetical protein [Alkalihalobacillus hemicentroti]